LTFTGDRYGRASTMLATQIPVLDWHDHLENATLSDTIMDRIVHNPIELKAESMRKRKSWTQYVYQDL
jgi:DNA replication protein DnaC